MKKSDHQIAVEAFEKFLNLEIKPIETLEEFFQKFELAYKALKNNGNTLNENILFSRLLKSLKLPDLEEKMIKANVSEFSCSQVKEILRKMYCATSSPSGKIFQGSKLSTSSDSVPEEESHRSLSLKRKRKDSERDPHISDCSTGNQHPVKSKDQKHNTSAPKRNPCHKCYSPHHWNSICDLSLKNDQHSPSTTHNIFISSSEKENNSKSRFKMG